MLRLAAAAAALFGIPLPAAEVSYHKEVRPILQAKCWGCHQPAKAMGKFAMTDFAGLRKGGDSGAAAIKPGDVAGSELAAQIALHGGKAAMPKNAPPLAESEIDAIGRWIKEGAKNDTPAAARAAIDAEHPPQYTKPPVVTALDWSPDGKLLAVAGFHEVLLADAESGKLAGRLVGLSERIQGVAFSPDGLRLAAVGGNPGRMGELQVWEVARRKLLLSKAVGADTVFGGRWSPDGATVAVGCPDNTVRTFDAKTGAQLLQQGAHADWPLDVAFSHDGKHLVSVGRDMTAKLTEVATQRFVDNITSITPGALKGGLQAVAAHPQRDEIAVGGSDGTPKVFRMHRTTARVIGDDANLVRNYPALPGRIFGVAISRDGTMLAAASALDGAGEILVAGYPLERDPKVEGRIKALEAKPQGKRSKAERAELAKLRRPTAEQVVRAKTPAGAYAVAFHPTEALVAAACGDGRVRVIDAATGAIARTFHPAPVAATAVARAAAAPDFVKDVAPILSRMGCNSGTCHGSAAGKNGFKLSLRGYDPRFDVRALTDDLASRRVNVASPDDSLMLLKASGAVPHVGGPLTKPGERYYQLLHDWIAAGATLNPKTMRVAKIDLQPRNPTLELPGATRQFKVVATYADGTTRDVTAEAFVESGEPDVATAAPRGGLLTAVRRGEAPTLARYEGAYAATTLTVMGDRTGFDWRTPEAWGRIDELVAAKWQRLKIAPSDLCTDAEFLRRAWLDLAGLPPAAEDVRKFLADPRPTRVKRDEVVDRLVGSPEYVERWANKWADLLQVNGKFLGREGATAFRQWIRAELAANTPYDQFARKVLTASGSNRVAPAASYFKILRDPAATMENTTHLFLGVRFNCNKCHDHPFERWTQDQYYQTSAYFAQVGFKADPESKGRNVAGGTAVDVARPLYEEIFDQSAGEVKHEKSGAVVPPKFPFPAKFADDAKAPRRTQLAAWLTSPDNPYFAKSYVNRLWGYLLGVGIIEPIDDIRAGNPPANPELLDFLTSEFVKSGFDVRRTTKLICKSRTYQLAVATNRWNRDDKRNFSHALPRRLEAETLYDTLVKAAGAKSRIPGVPDGTRAAELPDVGVELPSGFLGAFGRPVRESACECERSSGVQMGPVMALVNGGTLAEVLHAPDNALAKLAASQRDEAKLIDELFVRLVGRPATAPEIAACRPALSAPVAESTALAATLAQRAAEVAPLRAHQEKDRLAAIAKAKAELAAHEKAIAPAVAAAEKDRQGRIAAARGQLADCEKGLDAKLAKLSADSGQTPWTTIVPKSLKSTSGAKLANQPDGSILAEGELKSGTYVLEAETKLEGITALRLEVLADPKFPNRGPGRADDGNFVLNQLFVEIEGKMLGGFAKSTASFSQDGFPVAGAGDGQTNGDKGWALSPHTGITHWAVFEAKEPFGSAKGTKLTFKMDQYFGGGKFLLGRFRLSATTAKRPVPLGLAEEYRQLAAAPVAKRTPAQQDILRRLARATDPQHRTLTAALAGAERPLPTEPRLVELRRALAEAELPVREDARLAQLKLDAAAAGEQAKHARLTGVQDIAWALVNSPEFLFNH